MNRTVLCALLLNLLCSANANSQTISLDESARRFLDKKTIAYYDNHAPQTSELAGIAQDQTKAPIDRVTALQSLGTQFPLLGLSVAKTLISDRSQEITLSATQMLADSLAMSDHRLSSDTSNISAREKWLLATHENTKALLRRSLEDSRPKVRAVAAECLTSLSDEAGLTIIEEGVSTGLYTDTEAINYFGLAKPSVGGKKLEPYLTNNTSPETKAAAIAYLGAYVQYQEKVRDLALLEKSAPASVQISAAKTLGKHDKNYSTYALKIIQDKTLPPDVFDTVLDGYLTQKELSGNVTIQEKSMIKKAVGEYQAVRPEANSKILGTRIENLK